MFIQSAATATAATAIGTRFKGLRIAVILPCYNEEAAIGTVVADFQKALPEARIYVYDNNSMDRTSAVAAAAGAIVRSETLQGKGNVVRRMFADVDADIYLMCDGDITYDAASAPALVDKLVDENLDMVVGCRVDQSVAAYRTGQCVVYRFCCQPVWQTVHRYLVWLPGLLASLCKIVSCTVKRF
jgi:glycosyltransferase involved in cell wall biosynthesis